jgi:hypothetical protein
MNQYLSRDEKENLVRLMTLRVQLEKVIELYSGLKNVDKKFLSELRHARTRLENSAEIRLNYLDDQAKENLLLSIAKIRIMFMATPEAIQANKEMLQLRSTLPINVEDFKDWYEFVIEHSCKTCTKTDYIECAARRVLTKYDVVPVNPEAKEKCQYSYVGTPEAEELQEETAVDMVPAKKYNQAVAEFAALNAKAAGLEERLTEYDRLKGELNVVLHPDDDGPENPSMCDIVAYIRGDKNQFAKEIELLRGQVQNLQEQRDSLISQNAKSANKVEELAIEQVKDLWGEEDEDTVYDDDLLPLSLGLNNGNKLELWLPESMAKKLIADIQRPRLSRSICARYVDGEFVAIDLQEVVAMRVSGLIDADYIRPQLVQSQANSISERGRFRVECYCGAEYFADMYNGFREGRKKARCNTCGQDVFLDPQANKLTDPKDGAEAALLTNRYFVSQITPKTRELSVLPDLRDIKNIGRDYKDPCQLLG